jgi:hypothetical protein
MTTRECATMKTRSTRASVVLACLRRRIPRAVLKINKRARSMCAMCRRDSGATKHGGRLAAHTARGRRPPPHPMFGNRACGVCATAALAASRPVARRAPRGACHPRARGAVRTRAPAAGPPAAGPPAADSKPTPGRPDAETAIGHGGDMVHCCPRSGATCVHVSTPHAHEACCACACVQIYACAHAR